MIIIYYGFYYTVTNNRNENEVVVDNYDKIEIDYIHFNDFITHIHYIGRNKNKEKLK